MPKSVHPTTRDRSRLRTAVRKTVKWGGAALAVLLLVVWIWSCWYGWAQSIGGGRFVSVSMGQVRYTDASGVELGVTIAVTSGRAQEFHMDWGFHRQSGGPVSVLSVPLWPPLLISLLATVSAWRADAEHQCRARVGRCLACGYDRAGLAASAVCPECGGAAGV